MPSLPAGSHALSDCCCCLADWLSTCLTISVISSVWLYSDTVASAWCWVSVYIISDFVSLCMRMANPTLISSTVQVYCLYPRMQLYSESILACSCIVDVFWGLDFFYEMYFESSWCRYTDCFFVAEWESMKQTSKVIQKSLNPKFGERMFFPILMYKFDEETLGQKVKRPIEWLNFG